MKRTLGALAGVIAALTLLAMPVNAFQGKMATAAIGCPAKQTSFSNSGDVYLDLSAIPTGSYLVRVLSGTTVVAYNYTFNGQLTDTTSQKCFQLSSVAPTMPGQAGFSAPGSYTVQVATNASFSGGVTKQTGFKIL